MWGIGLVGLAAIVFVVTSANQSEKKAASSTAVHTTSPAEPPAPTGPFPRRLLAINVCNYLYLDPIHRGFKPHETSTVVRKLADFLHVPSSQMLLLSDAAPDKEAVPPIKPVIEKTVTNFLSGSRPQDRIVLLFSGHAVEVEDQPYLVPLDGEAGEAKTLIPLAWLYEQLGKCPARQKVFIADLCHTDPAHGSQRQGSGPLGEKLDAALQKPPEGVQVWSACSAGQFSYDDMGSLFLAALAKAVAGPDAARLTQKPADPLPLDILQVKVGKEVEREAGLLFKEKQTPRLSGAEATGREVPNDPKEPESARLALDWKPGKRVNADLIRNIVKQVESIPAVKGQADKSQELNADIFPLFSDDILKDYRPDNAKTPFRNAINQTLSELKKHDKAFPEEFRGDMNALKKKVAQDQKNLARLILDLEETLTNLENAGKLRDKEKSKRWQATYDYVHARLLERIAYTYEYNFMLANIRTDSLPELTTGKHTGWRLAAREKMQAKGEEGKLAKKYASDARAILKKLAEEHKGTPYEVLAKRDASNALGLEWQPTH